MSKYRYLTGSLSLCFSCKNRNKKLCPEFSTPIGSLDADTFHKIGSYFGGVSVQDCPMYNPNENELPEFALKRLKKLREYIE